MYPKYKTIQDINKYLNICLLGLSVIILTSFIFVENDLNKTDMSSSVPISVDMWITFTECQKMLLQYFMLLIWWIQWWTKNFLNIRWWIEYFIINCSNFWTGKFDFNNVKLNLHSAGTSPGILIEDFGLWTFDFFRGLLRITNWINH